MSFPCGVWMMGFCQCLPAKFTQDFGWPRAYSRRDLLKGNPVELNPKARGWEASFVTTRVFLSHLFLAKMQTWKRTKSLGIDFCLLKYHVRGSLYRLIAKITIQMLKNKIVASFRFLWDQTSVYYAGSVMCFWDALKEKILLVPCSAPHFQL